MDYGKAALSKVERMNKKIGKNLSRPSDGIVHFTIPLNMYQADINSNSLSVQDGSNIMNDNAILFLPTNYSENGEPIRLVIHCHGSGTNITPTTTSLSNPASNLIKLGYAVLDVNGRPEGYYGSLGLHFGAPFALQSYIKAYEFVTKYYNLKREVFVIGSSLGGLTSNMVVQSGIIPILAQGCFCGMVDHFKQAFCFPWFSGHRQLIAQFFGFTGVQPTWTSNTYATQAEKDYYKQNIDKVIGYNPMIKNTYNWNNNMLDNIWDSTEDTQYNTLIKYHPVPIKIWHCADDDIVLPKYSKFFVDAIRRSGGLAYYRQFPSGGHSAWDCGNSITMNDINNTSFTVTASTYELYQWFKRFEY